MSYLHCPTCHRAYNIATQLACPFCPVHATAVDATDDIVAAAEQLAHAMARATEAERDAAVVRMERLALPAPGARTAYHEDAMRSIRTVLRPPPPPPAQPRPLLHALAMAVLCRLEARPRLRRATELIRNRVRALAA